MIRCDGSVFRDFPVAQLSNYISKLCYLKTVASRVQYRGYYLLTMLELRVLTDKTNHLHILFFFYFFLQIPDIPIIESACEASYNPTTITSISNDNHNGNKKPINK